MAKVSKEPKPKWSEALLQLKFDLQATYSDPLLDEWLAVENNLTDAEIAQLEELRHDLIQNVAFWNEEELKIFFLGPVLKMANYQNETLFRPFLDREISSVVEGISLTTKADFMLSKGKGDVYSAPYFCFHEYKRKKNNADDPVAQVLVAMLIAQEENKNDKPIYGCYVMGAAWYFMIMQGKNYVQMSVPLMATSATDIQKILLVLQKFKIILKTQLV